MLDKSELKRVTKEDTTISPAEIERFDKMAENWWDPNGEYKMALAFNNARLEYFQAQIEEHFSINMRAARPFSGLRILDLGCGGGLVSESLAKLGAEVTGIDASEMSIQVARRHAVKSGVEVNYRHGLAKELIEEGEQYDVVINAEVIEHVPDQKGLISQTSKLVKEGGLCVLATLNRTIKSYFVGIIGAEYIMRYLPAGTHSWGLFVTPLEMNSWASLNRLQLVKETGMKFNILTRKWKLSNDLGVNYVQIYRKLPKS